MPLPDDPQLIRNLEIIEAQAIVDLLNAAPHDLQLQLGVAVIPLGSAVAIVMKQVPVLLLNRVIGLGIVEPATEQMVDEICSIYERAGVRTGVQLAPTAKPEQVKEWLEKRGLALTDTWGKLYRGSEPAGAAETDLRIEQIGRERAEEFGDIAAKAHQLPATLSNWIALSVGREGWRHYMAMDGEKGVGVAGLYVRGEVGWLGIAGTLPENRGRGAQSALIARRIMDGIEMGCKWLVVEADPDTPEHPNPSYRNLVRFGFKLAYERPNYRS